jgi:hypothetical protein
MNDQSDFDGFQRFSRRHGLSPRNRIAIFGFLPVPGFLPPRLGFDSVESVCEPRRLCVVVAFPTHFCAIRVELCLLVPHPHTLAPDHWLVQPAFIIFSRN